MQFPEYKGYIASLRIPFNHYVYSAGLCIHWLIVFNAQQVNLLEALAGLSDALFV